MRRFLSLRYVMTPNVPSEKNKMASTFVVSVITTGSVYKMQGGRALSEVKGKRKRCGEESENVFLWETSSGKAVLQFSYNN